MARQIALLRGINVGGHRKVPMARLRELLEELGFRDAKTYVQSGNVLLRAGREAPAKVARKLEQGIEATFGFDVAVVVRTRDQLAAVIDANPLGKVATDPKRHHVVFLDGTLGPKKIKELQEASVAPEVLHAGPSEIHVWSPDGARNSRAMKLLTDKKLGLTATARNWRTVEKLLETAGCTAACASCPNLLKAR